MRKTKKQKILAEYHLKLHALPSAPTPTIIRSSTDYSYVSSDLKRIGLWAALAIGAQFVLWYLLNMPLRR